MDTEEDQTTGFQEWVLVNRLTKERSPILTTKIFFKEHDLYLASPASETREEVHDQTILSSKLSGNWFLHVWSLWLSQQLLAGNIQGTKTSNGLYGLLGREFRH